MVERYGRGELIVFFLFIFGFAGSGSLYWPFKFIRTVADLYILWRYLILLACLK